MKNLIFTTFIAALLFASCSTRKNLKEIHVESLLKTTQSWNGDDLPHYKKGIPEVTILKITIPPGARLETHKHLVINAGVLTQGKLTVMTETEQTLDLKAGDSIAELVNTWHYGMNTGSKPAVIVVFYAGIEGEPITVLKKSDLK